MKRIQHTAVLVIASFLFTACAAPARRGLYDPPDERQRDPARAQALTLQAAGVAEDHPGRAEQLLKEALGADLYHGPAHNNLGVLYLVEGRLYEAASEFEFASRLMPGHPDPRMNLALTLERAGRTSDASASYRTALEVCPGHLPSVQALARLSVRTGRADADTAALLRDIAMRGDSEAWRGWARRLLTEHGL